MVISYKDTCIKTDFLRHNYSTLKPISKVEGVATYSLEDIAAMKLNAIANRGAKKYFYELHLMISIPFRRLMLP